MRTTTGRPYGYPLTPRTRIRRWCLVASAASLGLGLARAADPAITQGDTVTVPMDEDGSPVAFALQLEATDADGDDLSWSVQALPDHGDADPVPTTGNVVAVEYEPDDDYHGTDQFKVRVTDTAHGNDEIQVQVEIAPQNDPPYLTANAGMLLYQLQERTITPDLLGAADVDTNDTSQLAYTVDAAGSGMVTHTNTLKLDGVALTSGETFTQQDIDNGRLSYYAPMIPQRTDGFTFSVRDTEGALASDGGHTVFTFPIVILTSNLPPETVDGSGATGIGASVEDRFQATDPNLPADPLAFRIVQNGAHGFAEMVVTSNGLFRYTHTNGVPGTDTILFQVNDGTTDAAAPGTYLITIANRPPAVGDATAVSTNGRPAFGTLVVSDPDLPPQPLTVQVHTQGSKGTAAMHPGTGDFTYTPDEGRFGMDTFQVTASDGLTSSPPGTVQVTITHLPVEGDLLLTRNLSPNEGASYGSIIVVDAVSGDSAVVSEGGLLATPNDLAYDPLRRRIYTTDASFSGSVPPRIIETDPADGSQRIVSEQGLLQFPFGLDAEADGSIVVNNLAAQQVLRIDPVSGSQTVVSVGGLLQAPSGIEVQPDGRLYVLDAMDPQGPDGRLLAVDPTDGTQTLVSSNQNFVVPVDLASAADGTVYVTDMGGMLLAVDPVTGTQTVIAAGLASPVGIGSANRRELFHVASGNDGVGDATGAVHRIDADTGTRTTLADEGVLDANLWSLDAVPPMGWILTVAVSSNAPCIGWHSVSGVDYHIESCGDLEAAEWAFEDAVTGTGGWMRWAPDAVPPFPYFLRTVAQP